MPAVGFAAGYERLFLALAAQGIAAPEPLYVLRVEPDTRRVVVGANHRLRLSVEDPGQGGHYTPVPRIAHRNGHVP